MKKLHVLIFLLFGSVFLLSSWDCGPLLTTSPLSTVSTPITYTSVVTIAGQAGVTGATNGTGTSATFNGLSWIALDNSGNIYGIDYYNKLIRKITPGGIVTTLAGQVGVSGTTDGIGTAATFQDPEGIAVDSSGNVYVGEYLNCTIRRITPAGAVTTWAGQAGVLGTVNGPLTSATFWYPRDLAVDSSGNVFVLDAGNNVVRKITPGGSVSTFAGSGGYGTTDGTGTAASFEEVFGLSAAPNGCLYVADYYTMIRKITPSAVVSTAVAWALPGYVDGPLSTAQFDDIEDTVVDSSGNIYALDVTDAAIRKITPGGMVSTLVNNGSTGSPTLTSTTLVAPAGIAMDAAAHIFVADNNAILEIK